jgi:aromatic-L-amino-acid/L-tryptophan decarboxylase
MNDEASGLELGRERMLRMGVDALHAVCSLDQVPVPRPPAMPDAGLVDRLLAAPPQRPGELAPLLEVVLAAGAASQDTSGPRAFGHVPGSAPFASVLGALLGAAINRHTAYAEAAAPLVAMEQGIVRWLCDLIGLPESAGGLATSGGSLSTLTVLTAARDALPGRRVDGAAVYLAASAHSCIGKSLRVLGVGPEQVRTVARDAQGRMDAAALAEMTARDARDGVRPWLIVGTAGTTDRGSIDPLDALAKIARSTGAWLHVDAAYGGAFLLTGRRADMAGIDEADSVVIDAHKGLFVPFGLGFALVRRQESLRRAFSTRAGYLRDLAPRPGLADPADLGLELSRGPRVLPLWLTLWLHGTDAVAAALQEKLELAEHAYRRLAGGQLLQVPRPRLSTVIFRLRDGDNAAQQRLLDAIHAAGRGTLSSTVIDGAVWLRLCILNAHTHRRHVDDVLDAVLHAASALSTGDSGALARPEAARAA